jgi:hypothetical protein
MAPAHKHPPIARAKAVNLTKTDALNVIAQTNGRTCERLDPLPARHTSKSMGHRARLTAIVLLSVLPLTAARADNPPAFSAGSLAGWMPKTFSGRAPTLYQLTPDSGATVLHATCQNAASGLVWQHAVDLTKTPILAWRWKIGRLYPGLNPHAESGDDYPARVYVVAGDAMFPWTLRSLVYVWANGPVSPQIYPDPYTAQAQILVLKQGAPGPNVWQPESRNLRTDLATAFGADITKIGAVAVMTDCDDSHTTGEAWYGDITFRP